MKNSMLVKISNYIKTNKKKLLIRAAIIMVLWVLKKLVAWYFGINLVLLDFAWLRLFIGSLGELLNDIFVFYKADTCTPNKPWPSEGEAGPSKTETGVNNPAPNNNVVNIMGNRLNKNRTQVMADNIGKVLELHKQQKEQYGGTLPITRLRHCGLSDQDIYDLKRFLLEDHAANTSVWEKYSSADALNNNVRITRDLHGYLKYMAAHLDFK